MKIKRYIFLTFFFVPYLLSEASTKYDSVPIVLHTSIDDIETGNYIVVGAFQYEKNAKRLVLIALKNGFDGRYFYNESRALYYVYVYKFKKSRRAFRITKRIQSYKLFDDVWVFSVGNKPDLDLQSDHSTIEVNQRADEKPEVVQVDIPTTVDDNTSLAIVKLKNSKAGERVVFDKLLFHKSSAILRSGAREDLTALYSFLNENPETNIKIHGHTNGKFKGDIILLRKDDDSYYRLSRKNIVIKGNEMRLSSERALLLKKFLVDSGINPNRIEVKGWGAKKMIFNKDHFKSAQNRRVEVEIIK